MVLAPPPGIAERMFTWRQVADRFDHAFYVVSALPEPRNGRPAQLRAAWPDYSDPRDRQALIDMVGLKTNVRPAIPSAQAISDAEEAMGWLLRISDGYARQLVVLRAVGLSWASIGRQLGWSLRKVQYDHRTTLIALAAELSKNI